MEVFGVVDRADYGKRPELDIVVLDAEARDRFNFAHSCANWYPVAIFMYREEAQNYINNVNHAEDIRERRKIEWYKDADYKG